MGTPSRSSYPSAPDIHNLLFSAAPSHSATEQRSFKPMQACASYRGPCWSSSERALIDNREPLRLYRGYSERSNVSRHFDKGVTLDSDCDGVTNVERAGGQWKKRLSSSDVDIPQAVQWKCGICCSFMCDMKELFGGSSLWPRRVVHGADGPGARGARFPMRHRLLLQPLPGGTLSRPCISVPSIAVDSRRGSSRYGAWRLCCSFIRSSQGSWKASMSCTG